MRLLLFLLFMVGTCYAQDVQSIELIPSFKVGQTKKYRITSTSKSFVQEGYYEVFNSSLKDVIVKVISTKPGQTHIEWTYDRVVFVDSTDQNDPFLYLMNTLNKKMTVRYIVNSQGIIQSISNLEEIKTKTQQQIDGIIQQMSQNNNIDASLVETYKFQLEMTLSSQELFDALVLEDVYRFHELYGQSFQKDSKNHTQEKDTPADSYAVKLASYTNNSCQLNGDLVSPFSDKKGQKVYHFELPGFWLQTYSSKWYATLPMNVSNSYTINLTSSQ